MNYDDCYGGFRAVVWDWGYLRFDSFFHWEWGWGPHFYLGPRLYCSFQVDGFADFLMPTSIFCAQQSYQFWAYLVSIFTFLRGWMYTDHALPHLPFNRSVQDLLSSLSTSLSLDVEGGIFGLGLVLGLTVSMQVLKPCKSIVHFCRTSLSCWLIIPRTPDLPLVWFVQFLCEDGIAFGECLRVSSGFGICLSPTPLGPHIFCLKPCWKCAFIFTSVVFRDYSCGWADSQSGTECNVILYLGCDLVLEELGVLS